LNLDAYNLLKTVTLSKKGSGPKDMTAAAHPGRRSGGKSPLWIIDLGRQAYEEVWSLQKRLSEARQEERIPDVLLLLEHDPVFTLGRQGNWENVLLSREDLQSRGMACVRTERGGDVTYHGPGQLVGYPIVRVPGEGLKVKALVQSFEEVLLHTLARFGVQGRRDPKNPGVWVGRAKIGSIGIAVRRGISFHGFSLNVDMDLTPFSWIHTCGHQGLSLTSLREQLGRDVSLQEAKPIVASVFVESLSYHLCLPEAADVRDTTALGLPPLEERFRDGQESISGWMEPGRAPWA
jgi:lipoate-protein ligase B